MDLSPGARALLTFSRGVFLARRALSQPVDDEPSAPAPPIEAARRPNILFITTDQQRYDSLGVTGHPLAKTPSIDALARSGILYRRAHVQNVVCMPSRSTMLTGQHPLTHGVVANGISLDESSPNVARILRTAGYRTALVGKAHFDPHLDPLLRFPENQVAARRSTGPWRGFDHVELATHGPVGGHHYAAWLWDQHPEDVAGFGAVLTGSGGGETGAPEVKLNPIARERYHTDWIADRTIAWLRGHAEGAPFFCWMSFPDPHHPFDPPRDEIKKRGDFRARPLPAGHPGSPDRIRAILAKKPAHWLGWYEGRHRNPEGGPTNFAPARLEHDQLREIDHVIQVENELIDDAVGRVMRFLAESGLDGNTHVFFTSDHGELQGDFGLLFKGPYHVDSLMHVPLVWRPAPSASVTPEIIDEPVGLVDLAPTFCTIAGLPVPSEMEGSALPIEKGSGRERVLTTFDSQFSSIGMHLRTIFRDGMICTMYEASTKDRGGDFPFYSRVWLHGSELPRYEGVEGELYDLKNDPRQWENLWDDPSRRSLRDDLVADLRSALPRERIPRLRVASPT